MYVCIYCARQDSSASLSPFGYLLVVVFMHFMFPLCIVLRKSWRKIKTEITEKKKKSSQINKKQNIIILTFKLAFSKIFNFFCFSSTSAEVRSAFFNVTTIRHTKNFRGINFKISSFREFVPWTNI